MSDSSPVPSIPKWFSRSIVVLLAVQVGLMWTHGSLLQRQHDDIQALRQDVQDLTESLDQDQGQDPDDGSALGAQARPARNRLGSRVHRHRPVRVAFQQAVAKGRVVQEQLSISENIRKADEKAKLEAVGATRTWLWAGAALALAVLAARALLRRRG